VVHWDSASERRHVRDFRRDVSRPTERLAVPSNDDAAIEGSYLTPEEHRRLLIEAGFAEVKVILDERKGWIAATGRRAELAR
jgi:hypothetical protein